MTVAKSMDFFDALVGYETDLWNHVDERLHAAGTVSLAKLEALRVVQRHEGSCRVQEVSDDLSITVGAASKLVDRLEAAELVRRVPNPNDRRSALIMLTEAGVEASADALSVVDRVLGDHLSAEETDAVTQVLRRLRRGLRSDGTAVSA